ncbi:TM2 domain-containing protein [Shewanella sp. UCD-KL21]|uniref:TM2 domain-containing protein n=1 Tax=Shewanella sp. UCD-KL21 TaxID=1917164 RepID=UPI000970F451|nr:TM2 domain-containing protein [Shewanella sp. UCD-KL21]
MQQINCPQCSQKIDLNQVTCPQCHAALGLDALGGVDPDVRIKNQKLAIWFSVLFGGLGLHKFYLGQYLKGSLYLLFSWTLVPMVAGWVDAIRTIKMSPFSFQQRYSRKVDQYSA